MSREQLELRLQPPPLLHQLREELAIPEVEEHDRRTRVNEKGRLDLYYYLLLLFIRPTAFCVRFFLSRHNLKIDKALAQLEWNRIGGKDHQKGKEQGVLEDFSFALGHQRRAGGGRIPEGVASRRGVGCGLAVYPAPGSSRCGGRGGYGVWAREDLMRGSREAE